MRKLFLLLSFVIIIVIGKAQEFHHEFSIRSGGGLSGLNYYYPRDLIASEANGIISTKQTEKVHLLSCGVNLQTTVGAMSMQKGHGKDDGFLFNVISEEPAFEMAEHSLAPTMQHPVSSQQPATQAPVHRLTTRATDSPNKENDTSEIIITNVESATLPVRETTNNVPEEIVITNVETTTISAREIETNVPAITIPVKESTNNVPEEIVITNIETTATPARETMTNIPAAKNAAAEIVITNVSPTGTTVGETRTSNTPLNAWEEAIITTPIMFVYMGEWDILPEAEIQIDKVITILKKYPDLKLILEGHTCDISSSARNRIISFRRANEIVSYMTAQGISASRSKIVAKAYTEPVTRGITETERRENRRVLIKVANVFQK